MKLTKYISILVVILSMCMSCADDSLLPLPYNDRTTGAYLRIYSQRSSVFDFNDLGNSAFDAVFEPVDVNKGEDLASVDFFVSHRRGTDLTQEVFLKNVDATIFAAVPAPTYSEYKRGSIRLTANEILTALQTITTDPDGDGSDGNGDGIGDQCPLCIPFKGLSVFPGSFAIGDQINIRYEMVMKDGRRFSVTNSQGSVNPAFANSATANSTPNITTGLFYNSPFQVIMTVRSTIVGSWVGDYSLTQNSIWSPAHSVALHQSSYPAYMNEILFQNQTVTLAIPTGGLSTEREFQATYRGQTVTMRINLESGAVFIPLQNSTVNCSSERQLYWIYPTAGTFVPGGAGVLPAGLPQATTSNRGAYSTIINGLTAGDALTIGIDDDADEYGRRNGYCTWTRRVNLSLVKI